MQLEELMNVKVSSVSKREQKLSRVAAAVFVIGQEDIRRSGAANIPDLLRLAPGVDVQQIDANAWAISVRGFNGRYANKVLVLIDGRSVYTPSFSGVFWEHLDLPLEDIERIEIIRGPGATVWGANAVNGVISIITKSAHETKGALMTTAVGSSTKVEQTVQYGGAASPQASYRVFGKYFNIGDSVSGANPSADHWQRSHGGFRTDWDLSPRDSLMVQGDLFASQGSQLRRNNLIPSPADIIFRQVVDAAGGDVLARWTHTMAGGSQTSLQAYYDTYRRLDLGVPELQRAFDLDFQDHVTAGSRHDIVWGAGFRSYYSALAAGYWIRGIPPARTDSFYSTFFQDEIRLADTVWLTLGSKLEHNVYTGFQTEPSIRLLWSPGAGRSALWAAASKAIRQPSRADTDVQLDLQRVPVGPDLVAAVRLVGNPNIRNEEARDYEAGYRAELGKKLTFDITGFATFFRRIDTSEPGGVTVIPGSPVVLEVPVFTGNLAHVIDYGGELALSWSVTGRWRLSPGYSYLHATIWADAASRGYPYAKIPTDFPQNTAVVRSSVNLDRKTEFDQALYYTARLPGGAIPGHARLDIRLGRRVGERARLSVVGQNLLRPRTMEFGDSFGVVGAPAVRSVYGKLEWRF